MKISVQKHKKEITWALLLQGVYKKNYLQFFLLTKYNGLTISCISTSSKKPHPFTVYTKSISLVQTTITPNIDEYTILHAILYHYPFTNLNQKLDRFARISFWRECLIISRAGGKENNFFIFYYHLILWLNNLEVKSYQLDTVFLYYFLLINGVLPEHLNTQPSFASLTHLSLEQFNQHLNNLEKNSFLYNKLLDIFLSFMPYPPHSLAQLRYYD